MGERLDEEFGSDMVVLGSVHRRGHAAAVGGAQGGLPVADPESVAGVLGDAGRAAFVLDLRSGEATLRERLASPRALRTATGDLDEPVLIAAECFDAIVYLDRISPVRAIEATV
jgi:erythromycin esterase-like protein